LLAGGFANLKRLWARKVCVVLAMLWITLPLYLVAGHFLSFVDLDYSPRYLATRISARGLSSDVRTYGVNRAWQYGLNYYLHTEIPEWQSNIPAESYVILSMEECQELKKKGFRIQLVEFGESGATKQSLSLYRVSPRSVSGQVSL
jgi:hypothetical protein